MSEQLGIPTYRPRTQCSRICFLCVGRNHKNEVVTSWIETRYIKGKVTDRRRKNQVNSINTVLEGFSEHTGLEYFIEVYGSNELCRAYAEAHGWVV